jgi:hypothetical protein
VRRYVRVLSVGLVVCAACSSSGSAKTAGPRPTISSTSSVPVTPLSNAEILRRVSWQAGDIRSPYRTMLFIGGNQVQDQVTLDLCSANFPSEARRVARHQVGITDAHQRDSGISIEAVLYDSPRRRRSSNA